MTNTDIIKRMLEIEQALGDVRIFTGMSNDEAFTGVIKCRKDLTNLMQEISQEIWVKAYLHSVEGSEMPNE